MRRSEYPAGAYRGRPPSWLAIALVLLSLRLWDAEGAPPYPRSEVFTGLEFERETLLRVAEGSDIWNCTWADNGQLYATWGDGGGFGGTDSIGRASLGVATIGGLPPAWQGTNVWGGVDPLSTQAATVGKAAIIALGSTLYLYNSEQGRWDRSALWKSADLGRTWTNCGWILPQSHKVFAFPGLVQHGQGNRLSPDGYVYGFSDNDPQRVHDRRLYLFRVKAERLETLAAYEYFAGNASAPRWSSRLEDLQPVFADAEGVSWGTTCVYHPASGRYLLSVSIDPERGGWGVYESRHPWGPWRTVAYGDDLPEWTHAPAEKKRPAYVHTFPAKWISADGRTLWCVFDRGDRFNLARCRLKLRQP